MIARERKIASKAELPQSPDGDSSLSEGALSGISHMCHEVPEGVNKRFKPFSLPQSPIGDSPLVRGGQIHQLSRGDQ